MASASLRPTRSLKRRHPLRTPLLPHLCVDPHGDLSSPGGVPGSGGDEADSGQHAQCLSPDRAGRYQPAELTDNGAGQPLRVPTSSSAAQVCHPSSSAALDESVQVLAPFSPIPCHEALELAEALEPLLSNIAVIAVIKHQKVIKTQWFALGVVPNHECHYERVSAAKSELF